MTGCPRPPGTWPGRRSRSSSEARPLPARTVLYLHSSAGRYGADRQLALLARGLDHHRFRPLVVLARDGPLRGDLRAAGVEVHVRELAVLRRALLNARGLTGVVGAVGGDARALGGLVRARRVALVHSNTSVTLGGAAAARAAGVPHVWHVRESYDDFPRFWPAYRRVLLSADSVPCVSRAMAAQFAGAPAARVLHDGLALAPRRAERAAARHVLGLPQEAFVIALAGRLSAWKGQDVLVRALAEGALGARAPLSAHALLAGDAWPGEERRADDLRVLAGQLGVADRVHLPGFRDDAETVYGAADVVAVPSTRPDPLPNAALEAAAAGCCVVASAHGGLPEIVRDGETGVLVTPGDPQALGAALALLRDDPGRRERLGAAASADVGKRFSPQRMVAAVQELYDGLLG
ncbi:MAG TPA: glycosyltransferase [Solirubrobacteraceae bacterium]|nr:glycosyltransferase [Solirubrobacteraceae bacterium]